MPRLPPSTVHLPLSTFLSTVQLNFAFSALRWTHRIRVFYYHTSLANPALPNSKVSSTALASFSARARLLPRTTRWCVGIGNCELKSASSSSSRAPSRLSHNASTCSLSSSLCLALLAPSRELFGRSSSISCSQTIHQLPLEIDQIHHTAAITLINKQY